MTLTDELRARASNIEDPALGDALEEAADAIDGLEQRLAKLEAHVMPQQPPENWGGA